VSPGSRMPPCLGDSIAEGSGVVGADAFAEGNTGSGRSPGLLPLREPGCGEELPELVRTNCGFGVGPALLVRGSGCFDGSSEYDEERDSSTGRSCDERSDD
jgi:hypothetical protein